MLKDLFFKTERRRKNIFKKKKAQGYKRVWDTKEMGYLMEHMVNEGERKAVVELQKS